MCARKHTEETWYYFCLNCHFAIWTKPPSSLVCRKLQTCSATTIIEVEDLFQLRARMLVVQMQSMLQCLSMMATLQRRTIYAKDVCIGPRNQEDEKKIALVWYNRKKKGNTPNSVIPREKLCCQLAFQSSLVNTLPITKKNKHTVVTEAPKKVHVLLSRQQICSRRPIQALSRGI